MCADTAKVPPNKQAPRLPFTPNSPRLAGLRASLGFATPRPRLQWPRPPGPPPPPPRSSRHDATGCPSTPCTST
eukprot:5244167-Prymnesium_polylepis.1